MLEMTIGNRDAVAVLSDLMKDMDRGSGIMRNALEQIGREARNSIITNFQVGGRPTWVPNAPYTIKHKGSNTPLIDTGRLMHSTEYKINGNTVTLSNDVPYGWVHQFGYGNIPKREWFVLQPEDHVKFANIIQSALNQYFGGDTPMKGWEYNKNGSA